MTFIELLLEYKADRFNYTSKESPKKQFKTYTCYYVIKVKKKFNRNLIYERIRSLPDISTVDVETNPKLEKMSEKSTEYEYNLLRLKFLTYKDPQKKVEEIKDQMLHNFPDKDTFAVLGIVSVKPQEDTIKNVD